MDSAHLDSRTIRVFVPVGKTTPTQARASSDAAPGNPNVHVIGLLDNHKHNTDKILDRLQQRLGDEYAGLRFVRAKKPEAGKPAPTQVIDALAAECQAVINGVAD
jgi:hypothetical protein